MHGRVAAVPADLSTRRHLPVIAAPALLTNPNPNLRHQCTLKDTQTSEPTPPQLPAPRPTTGCPPFQTMPRAPSTWRPRARTFCPRSTAATPHTRGRAAPAWQRRSSVAPPRCSRRRRPGPRRSKSSEPCVRPALPAGRPAAADAVRLHVRWGVGVGWWGREPAFSELAGIVM